MNAKPDTARRPRPIWQGPAIFAAIALMFPITGSLLIRDWHWHPIAFVVVGLLFFAVGMIFQLLTRHSGSWAYRAAVGIACTATFGLMWGSLVQWADVTRFAAFYFVVPVVEVVGAAFARLRPAGMARALFVTAAVEMLLVTVGLLLLLREAPDATTWTPPEVRGFAGNVVNALMFAGAGFLFRRSARSQSAASS